MKRKQRKQAKAQMKELTAILKRIKAAFDQRVMRAQIDAQDAVPERCPCGKKWKNCRHRDELLGTHH